MFQLAPATAGEFESALDLIGTNMTPVLSHHGLSCDRSWNRKNFQGKENYSIFTDGNWIGFISVELEPGRLFVHTLQLVAAAQGNIYGGLVLQWLYAQASARSLRSFACKAVSGSTAAKLYRRLGFTVTDEAGALIELTLNLDYADTGIEATAPSRLLRVLYRNSRPARSQQHG